MIKLKKILVLGLVIAIFCSMGGTAFATERENENELKTDMNPIVIIEDTDISVPDSVIQELINENPEAGQIVITEYGKSKINRHESLMQFMSPSAGIYYSNVSKTQLDSDILVSINFVTSVARGESKVLGSSWSSTLSSTCHDPLAGWYIKYPVSGTYTEPAYYISYNIDSIVSN